MRNSISSRWLAAWVTILFMLVCSRTSRAQTGPALLVKPWPMKDEMFDGRAEAFFFNAGHTSEPHDKFHLSMFDSVGRFRIIPGSEISPRIGYDFNFLDLHTPNKKLPNYLSDESVAVGSGLFQQGKWIGAMTLGVGYAGDNAFGNGAAWYGKADVILVRQLDHEDYLGFVVDYDGHRTYAPDIPLPGFGYSHRFDPKLQMVLGVPYSSVSWTPIDRLDIEAEYAILSDIRVNIGYEFLRHLTAYGLFDYSRDAYHVSNLPKDRRLLFFQYRLEAGIRYQPIRQVSVGLGAGYGFDGQFRSGFDFQRTHAVTDFSDSPYVRGEVEVRF